MTDTPTSRSPSMLQALVPLIFLIIALATSVYLFADDAAYGGNQIALLLAGGVAALIGLYNGMRWKEIQDAMARGIELAAGAMLILLAVGALIGTWMMSGTVPTLIDYGLQLMNPSWFYPTTCLVCALVALTIGSSWTVAGTLGVALIAVAQGLDLSPAITAGAVISGAYFGDKMSPLSDTTNLAPAAAGSELFAHVRHMVWTTAPSILLALIGFTIIGFSTQGASGSAAGFGDLSAQLHSQFSLGLHLLIPLVVVLAMAMRWMPAYPTILIGALLGGVWAVLFQPEHVTRLAANADLSTPMAMLKGAVEALVNGFKLESGNEALDELVSRGGMVGMLNTIWLILCAMSFGAVMEHTGLLERLIRSVLAAAKSTGSLITATLATAFGVNLACADQYLAIVLPGRIYRPEYARRGLDPVNLSRALEDAGTVTSPLVPWNTCGAFMAVTLGVSTMDYLPFALFNLINPFVAAIMAYVGFKILRLTPQAEITSRNA